MRCDRNGVDPVHCTGRFPVLVWSYFSPSARTYACVTREPLDGFALNLTSENLMKNCTSQYIYIYIHALSGIRTHDPGFRASEDNACGLRPLGYRDRLTVPYSEIILPLCCDTRDNENILSVFF
jgi:hypothetical protein